MTWVRLGDTAATDPMVLELSEAPGADERTRNEAFGFLALLCTCAGAHDTDYMVSRATAHLLGGKRTDALLAACEHTGLLTRTQVDGRPMWRIVNDRHELVHLRLKSEKDWEQQRRGDRSKPALTIPVRVRDGDACRYCGLVVNWKDKKGTLGGTYDHLDPAQPATVDTYVVACRGCNSKLGASTPQERLPLLLPEPTTAYHAPDTVAWVNSNKWAVLNNLTLPAPQGPALEPGTLAHPRPSDPAPSRTTQPQRPGAQPDNATPATRHPAGQRGTPAGGGPREGADLADLPDPIQIRRAGEAAESRSAGSGRVGTGRDGTGAAPPAPRRRGRRSRAAGPTEGVAGR